MLSIEKALVSLDSAPTLPRMEDLISIAHQCRAEKAGVHAKQVHLHACNHGLDAHPALGNHIVPMLVDCAHLSGACQVFNRLPTHNEYAWTSIIEGHADCGDFECVFPLFQQMQEDCVQPTTYTFLVLLKACISLKRLDLGQWLHSEIAKEGYEKDLSLATKLLDMYAKCGDLSEAQEVFDELPVRDVVAWTSLILVYIEYGLSKEALCSLQRMASDRIYADAFTFVAILKACGSSGAIEKGHETYSELVKQGFERDHFIGNTIVGMYIKCGSLYEALQVFAGLHVQDVVSWNALIAGQAEYGLEEEALQCLEEMISNGSRPNDVTFLCGLKACANIEDNDNGLQLHACIIVEGYEHELSVGNAIVGMYAKCGLFNEAWEVFDNLFVRNIYTWTGLIAGYSEHGCGHEALDCLAQMQIEGVLPDGPTYACSLKACGIIHAIESGRELHLEIVTEGFERGGFVCNTLVDFYIRCGFLGEARDVFDDLVDRDVISWNVLVSGYAECGQLVKALHCLEDMRSDGIPPDTVTFVCCLKACGNIGSPDLGQQLHDEIAKVGFENDSHVFNSLIDMYCKCGLLADALAMFDGTPCRDITSWTTIISGFGECGLGDEACNFFHQMQLVCLSPDAESWHAVILGYAEQRESERCLQLFGQMQEQGLLPNNATFVITLHVFGDMAALEPGKKSHARFHEGTLGSSHVVMGNALVDMYGKCGSMADAQHAFEAISAKDLVTWNALVTGFSRQGESGCLFQLLEKMRKEKLPPDEVTFLSILAVCTHVGLMQKGREYFEGASKEYGLIPRIEHCHCIADLLCRAGQVDEAVSILKEMPFQHDSVTWGTMLGACRRWGYLDLGKQAFERAMGSVKNSGVFISLSNIYANACILEEQNNP